MTEPSEAPADGERACTAALARLKDDDGGPPCPSCFAEGFRAGFAASAAERERLVDLARGWRERAARAEQEADPETDPRTDVWDSCADGLETALSSGQGEDQR